MAKLQRKSKKVKPTKKSCYFTKNNTTPDYKDVLVLKRFINDRSKIIPATYSGVTSKNQRKLTREIKKARFMSLIPYTDQHAL